MVLRGGLAVLLGGLARTGRAQPPPPVEDPRLLRLDVKEVYFQTDVEAEQNTQEAGTPAVRLSQRRLLLQPVGGLTLDGSLYHPNLLQYRCNTELGLDYNYARMDPGASGSGEHFLERYHGMFTLLREKPYATSIFADKDLTYRDYDFFSRVRVDSERYGGRSGYTAGPIPFSVSYQHYDERLVDVSRPMHNAETTCTFNASNQHRDDRGTTQFDYNVNQYQRQDASFSDQRGVSHNINCADTERFGADDWVNLNSLLHWNALAETTVPSSRFLLQEDLRLQHTHNFSSFYNYAYDNASSGDANTDGHQLRLGVSHTWRECLVSTFDVHGGMTSAAGNGSSTDSKRYGLTLSEQYTRKLSDWANFTLGYKLDLDHESRDSSGGAQNVIDENVHLKDGLNTFLALPSVSTGTLRVTDPTSTIVYVRDVDYELVEVGPLTQIRRLPGGTIPNDSTVLASYSSSLNPAVAFSSLGNAVNGRIDFWKGVLGLYARWTSLEFDGGESLLLRTLDDKTVGVDSTWRWLRAGAEYEMADSNLAPFERKRLYQSAQFSAAQDVKLGVNVDQNWTTFTDTHMRQTSYGVLVRFQQMLTPYFSWNTEGGVRFDRGSTFNEDAAVSRTGFDFALGKLNFKLSYEYNNQKHQLDLNERHRFIFRMRRYF